MTTGLILGAAVWENGPSPTMMRRTRHGAHLFHRGHVSRLVVCGGLGTFAPTEADAMAQILRDGDVPETAITREDKSTTTGENIAFARAFLDATDVVIITDWYHAPRARLIARRLGVRATSNAPSLKGAKIWPQTKGALREVPAYLAYALYLTPGARAGL